MTQLKTVFVITVLTSRMLMPGMPSLPAGMGMPEMGAPTKSMTMDLTSDKKVDASSTAQCAVPEGLKLGPKVDLEIDLPVKEKVAPVGGPAEGTKPAATKFVMKSYWDCSGTVLPGQPKVVDTDQMMKGMPAGGMMGGGKMRGMPSMRSMAAGDGKSHAYWPNSKDGKKIVKDSSSPGPYELTTNYCGGTSITFDKDQEFLAGIDITNPGKGALDLEKAIKIEWKSVPLAQAYIITAFAGKKGEMVMWTSSSKPDVTVDWMGTAFTKAEIAGYITKGILLPATATSCSIPAGIFKDMGAPMITMTALGVDKMQEKNGIQTNVIVRSTGMLMAGRGFGGAMIEDSPATNQPEDTTTTDTTSSNNTTAPPAPPPASNTAADKAKDALHKLGGIFKH